MVERHKALPPCHPCHMVRHTSRHHGRPPAADLADRANKAKSPRGALFQEVTPKDDAHGVDLARSAEPGRAPSGCGRCATACLGGGTASHSSGHRDELLNIRGPAVGARRCLRTCAGKYDFFVVYAATAAVIFVDGHCLLPSEILPNYRDFSSNPLRAALGSAPTCCWTILPPLKSRSAGMDMIPNWPA